MKRGFIIKTVTIWTPSDKIDGRIDNRENYNEDLKTAWVSLKLAHEPLPFKQTGTKKQWADYRNHDIIRRRFLFQKMQNNCLSN